MTKQQKLPRTCLPHDREASHKRVSADCSIPTAWNPLRTSVYHDLRGRTLGPDILDFSGRHISVSVHQSGKWNSCTAWSAAHHVQGLGEMKKPLAVPCRMTLLPCEPPRYIRKRERNAWIRGNTLIRLVSKCYTRWHDRQILVFLIFRNHYANCPGFFIYLPGVAF